MNELSSPPHGQVDKTVTERTEAENPSPASPQLPIILLSSPVGELGLVCHKESSRNVLATLKP